jgi:hypothetical protein
MDAGGIVFGSSVHFKLKYMPKSVAISEIRVLQGGA